jgi:hypothetical protein
MENYGRREDECLEPREAKLIVAKHNQHAYFVSTFSLLLFKTFFSHVAVTSCISLISEIKNYCKHALIIFLFVVLELPIG